MSELENSRQEYVFGDEDRVNGKRSCPISGADYGPPVQAHGFRLQKSHDPRGEAQIFLAQMARETQKDNDWLKNRIARMHHEFDRTGTWQHSKEELVFGARIAWRNSTRCIGRMFWPSLHLFDAREAKTAEDMFDAILAHIDYATHQGALRPAITIFAQSPQRRILNSQLILYAGYPQQDGTVIGDPKNIDITKLAQRLGWKGQGTRFDILPLLIQTGNHMPELFNIPSEKILEVPIRHPEHVAVEKLGLKWFALPAVAGMALDLGGVHYTAAPSSGIYQVTEIGSFNLGDPRRYNILPSFAAALEIETGHHNPLWKDQALVELNRAVFHSFRLDGVSIMDHHALSNSFEKFCRREETQNRPVYGHWPWIVPPMSANLSWIWHEKTFKNVILKPNYFYQDFPEITCPQNRAL